MPKILNKILRIYKLSSSGSIPDRSLLQQIFINRKTLVNLKKMVNKKAQSQIITTILIILLVLAAIIIVWQVVQGTIEQGSLEIEGQSSCLGLRVDITSATNESGEVIIRPTKDISGYNIYVEGVEFNTSDTPLSALSTATLDNEDLGLEKNQEIEVIATINGAVCPGTKYIVK